MQKRFPLIAILAMGLLLTCAGFALAADFSDTQGHWAESQINNWSEKGLTGGYSDGTFKPNNTITRAEFIALVNRAFDFTETDEVNFTDVKPTNWFAGEIAKAKAAGYVGGYSDGTIKPNNQITRQEAASMLARILELNERNSTDSVEKFADAQSIPQWSKGAIGAVVVKGYMGGYPDQTFKPTQAITRAEAIVTIDRAIGQVELPAESPVKDVTYDQAGTYGPKSGTETIEGDVTVTADGVTLQNLNIKGDLTLAEEIGEGEVTLTNVTVKGNTDVYGGGENSIIISNSNLGKLNVSKENGKIRIVVSGNTTVDEVVANSGAKLEEQSITGEGFKEVVIDAQDADKITLVGTFESVDVKSEGVTIDVPRGTTVNTITLDAAAKVTGQGKITTAKVNADGVSFQKSPTNINKAEGVSSPTVSRPSGGGGGGGSSSGSNTVTVSDIKGKDAITRNALSPNSSNPVQYNWDEYTVTVRNSKETVTWSVYNETAGYIEPGVKVRGFSYAVNQDNKNSVIAAVYKDAIVDDKFTIKATLGSIEKTKTITIVEPRLAVIKIAGESVVTVGTTEQYYSTAFDHLTYEMDQTVTWSVDPGTGEATIDENGILTATKVGTVMVIATSEENPEFSSVKQVTIVPESETKMHTVIFKVCDKNTSEPIEGATVSVDETVIETDVNGCAEFELTPGQHTYTVSAEGYEGQSNMIFEASTDQQEIPLCLEEIAEPTVGAVTGLTVTPGDGQVKLSWTAAVNAVKHCVEIYEGQKTNNWTEGYITCLETTDTSMTVDTFEIDDVGNTYTLKNDGTTYTFKVYGVDGSGQWGEDAIVHATPNVQ
ncbi:S-layer homology domain-containing protein [Peptococcaceae bacterium 1198_IL3148]